MTYKIIVIDQDSNVRDSMQSIFKSEGFITEAYDNAEIALKSIQKHFADVVITDISLPGIDGLELVKKAKTISPNTCFIVTTNYASVETAVEALRLKVADYIIKPLIHDEIRHSVKRALLDKPENPAFYPKRHSDAKFNMNQIVGSSPQIKKTLAEIALISNTKSNVLILGETGTGKELIAKAMHYNSKRADKPFIAINCSAIPDALLESELFGHVKGSFTGAIVSKKGLFEEANGGTVFLDEIGDLSLMLQVKLLRTLEDMEIRPVGGINPVKLDVRFIFATNCDLKSAMMEKKFREDLFYRINVLNIKLPPLRERKSDIAMLAYHFAKKFALENNKIITSIDADVLQLFQHYHWPGNIRELQNVIERAVITAESSVITLKHLPDDLLIPAFSNEVEASSKSYSIEEYTKQFILKHQHRYSEQQLADMLGITRKALWEKRKRWNINRQEALY